MYDIHLGLLGKHVVDFLLVLIERFSLEVTAEAVSGKPEVLSFQVSGLIGLKISA